MSSVSHDSHSPRSLARTPQVGHSYISHCSMSTLGLIHEYKKCSVIYLLWQLWYSHRIEARGFPRGAARWLCILDRTLTETIGILVMICIQAVKATTPRWVHYIGSRSRRGEAWHAWGWVSVWISQTTIDPTHPRKMSGHPTQDCFVILETSTQL